jgi:predicted ester cyclase
VGTQENKELVRRYYEEIVSTGSVDRIAEYISSDYVEVHEGIRHPIGIGGAKDHILGVRQTYPDLKLKIEQQIAEGEWVVSRVLMKGTHEGEWMGIQPTGQAVTISAVNIDRIVGGRIVEHGGAANILESLMRIGAIKIVGKEL